MQRMTLPRSGAWLLLLIVLLATGCGPGSANRSPFVSVADAPPVSVLTLDELRNADGGVISVFNAVDLQPDPQIALLLDALSQQTLIGYVQTLESFGTRNSFSPIDRDDFGIGAARRWIFSEFERVGNGRLDVQFQDYTLSFQGEVNTQRNIIATLPGVGPRPKVFVLMANYDTRPEDWLDGESLAPGADDNASGVSALLEIARVMSSREWEHTIIFAAFTAEEQGTFGARAFMREAFFDDLQVDAAINNDMIGGRAGIPQSVRLFSVGPHTSNARQLARYIDLIGGMYLPDFPITQFDGLDRDGRWGDQREFVNAGIAAVRFIESQENFEIQNSVLDTWRLIDFDYLLNVTKLNLAIIANLAAAPARPEPPRLARDTAGNWVVNWEPDVRAGGYAIGVRAVSDFGYDPEQFRYVSRADAGRVAITGLAPEQAYAVSLIALDGNGRPGQFSDEVILEP